MARGVPNDLAARQTSARARIVAALAKVTEDGWPASVTEIQRAAGHASRGTTYEHLEQLVREGLARRHPRNQKGGYLPADRLGEFTDRMLAL